MYTHTHRAIIQKENNNKKKLNFQTSNYPVLVSSIQILHFMYLHHLSYTSNHRTSNTDQQPFTRSHYMYHFTPPSRSSIILPKAAENSFSFYPSRRKSCTKTIVIVQVLKIPLGCCLFPLATAHIPTTCS